MIKPTDETHAGNGQRAGQQEDSGRVGPGDLPLLLVVAGMPSSGKTTVAEGLAGRLRLPLIAKDEIKESLWDTLGTGSVSSSALLGGAAGNTAPRSSPPGAVVGNGGGTILGVR